MSFVISGDKSDVSGIFLGLPGHMLDFFLRHLKNLSMLESAFFFSRRTINSISSPFWQIFVSYSCRGSDNLDDNKRVWYSLLILTSHAVIHSILSDQCD